MRTTATSQPGQPKPPTVLASRTAVARELDFRISDGITCGCSGTSRRTMSRSPLTTDTSGRHFCSRSTALMPYTPSTPYAYAPTDA